MSKCNNGERWKSRKRCIIEATIRNFDARKWPSVACCWEINEGSALLGVRQSRNWPALAPSGVQRPSWIGFSWGLSPAHPSSGPAVRWPLRRVTGFCNLDPLSAALESVMSRRHEKASLLIIVKCEKPRGSLCTGFLFCFCFALPAAVYLLGFKCDNSEGTVEHPLGISLIDS